MNVKGTLGKYLVHMMIAAVIAAFLGGWFIRGMGSGPGMEGAHDHDQAAPEIAVEEWTCSMHPQIRLPNPGQCPICGMDLIPVASKSSASSGSPRELTLSPAAAKLAEIIVAPVERRNVTRDIPLVGKIAWDESRFSTISAWFAGRVDRLYVEITGGEVRKGDRLAEIYSPELRTTQDELIEAKKRLKAMETSPGSAADDFAERTVAAVREKLRLLGLSDEQIAAFEASETPSDHVTVFSTADGVVAVRNLTEGDYVKTGSKLFTIADPDTVWIILDVFESDLVWIRPGLVATLATEAYPGEKFTGEVTFIDPVLNDRTRTVKVRVEAPNPGGRLRPDMFVRAMLHAELPRKKKTDPPLVIPATAPLITGKRAVVYVADPGRTGTYEGREVTLGLRAGKYYTVEEGLAEGELVVVNGAFKIDSAVQILAGPSMMSPGGGERMTGHQHGGMEPANVPGQLPENLTGENIGTTYDVPDEFQARMDSVYAAYFRVHHALSHDSLGGAKAGAAEVSKALDGVDMTLLDNDPHIAWMRELGHMRESIGTIADAGSLDDARTAFKPLSDALIRAAHMFGVSGAVAVYRFHCPMAFDNAGSDWLQGKEELENPWFGSKMLKCGTLEETISAGGGKPGDAKN